MTFTDAHPEKDGRSAKQRQSAPLQHSDISVSAAVHSVKTHPAPENASVKTVRATMFEHNVERHTVAAKRLETERKSQPASDPITGQAGHSRESWVEKVLDAKVTSRKASSMATDGEKAKKTRPVNEDKTTQAATAWEKRVSKERCDKIPTKPVEDSLVYQRIEPRYEILQMIGERVRSEAITTATEDKAVTLRSKRSLKERRRTDGVVADAAWSRSLDIQGEEISIPKVKDSGENAVNTTPTRDHPKGSSHERVAEVNRNWTGPQLATATAQRASYFANIKKDWEQTEEKVFKPSSAETEKDHREAPLVDKMKEGPRMPKRFPEIFGVEVCESRASVEKSATGDCENVHRMSQWQTFARLSGDPPRISGQDESRVLSAQEGSDVSDRRSKGDGFGELGADERVGKSGRGASPPKPVERWRRKTLPHDAFRIEEAQERGKSPSRRDSFQFGDGSVAKGSAKPKEARDGRSSSESDLKNQLSSPSDSKATYFALTYQIPDANENTPTKQSDPPKNKDVSSPASVPPSASIGKTHHLRESYNQEPLKARDVKRSPPHWGTQGLEKPVDQASAQKKTFIVDEEEGADLVRRHQTAKLTNYGGPLGAEMNFVPPSDASSEGASWTGMKWETGVRKEVHLHADVNLSGFGKRTVGASERGRDSDASVAKRGPESGFSNAPPDLRRSYSEKVRQSRVRGGGFPFGQKVEDQSGDRQSVPLPETVDNWSSKWSASPHGVFISDGKKVCVIVEQNVHIVCK
ncbi:hypothetical protein JD844_015255 [Phrynosoma platyrhinos]|uniref:Uncharacterized protein n=1 Tax=Phrynosoma platyrhinos TaxID=52577 RepID=A0ABQ7T8C4_PHRPL|nr:hypothetical protein JD844_015255 [Phrynosoma platyrhinos]